MKEMNLEKYTGTIESLKLANAVLDDWKNVQFPTFNKSTVEALSELMDTRVIQKLARMAVHTTLTRLIEEQVRCKPPPCDEFGAPTGDLNKHPDAFDVEVNDGDDDWVYSPI